MGDQHGSRCWPLVLCGSRRSRLGKSWYASIPKAQSRASLTPLPTHSRTGELLLKIVLQPVGLFPWDVITLPGNAVCDAPPQPCRVDDYVQGEAAVASFVSTCDDGPRELASCSALPTATRDEVVLVASMHCARSNSGARQEKDCHLVVLKVACRTPEGGLPRMQVLWQQTRKLPRNLDHANMMCADTGH